MKKIILFIILVLAALAVFLFPNKFTGEDSWICKNGQWIKHGHPSAAMPEEPCGGVVVNCGSYMPNECPEECVVCPPCMECSSISCQTESFCGNLGIDRTWYENIKHQMEMSEMIKLNSPKPNEKISSPLKIEGEARGMWFFEGDFPIVLTDWDGLIIAEGIATAQGNWMTEDFVKFSAELEFAKPAYGETGNLILRKDNPSGMPENDDAFEIQVKF